jgi:hypothetical protein
MKVAAFCLALAGSASAFAPQSQPKASTALNEAPFGVLAPFNENFYLGKNEWELLTTKWGSEDTGNYMRASELKHGRGAMLAVVGYACEKFGITFDKISPHEYLSVTQNIKFADLAAMSPIDAVKAVPVEGYAQVFAAIAAIEIFELTHKDGELKRWETIAPGLKSGGMNGEIGWNPLKFEMSEKLRLNEISNGRAAMVAIAAWVSAEAIPGSVPIPLPWSN